MIKLEQMDIKKTEDMKMSHNMYMNGHSYLVLYRSEDKSEELIEPQFIYSHDICVGIIHQVLEEQPYYQLFIRPEIAAEWTADILLNVQMYLYYEGGIQILGTFGGKYPKKDKRYNKKVYKHYNRLTNKIKKRVQRIETLQYLNDVKNMMSDSREIYDINIKLQPDKVKRRVK